MENFDFSANPCKVLSKQQLWKEWCKPKMECVCFQLKLCFWKCVVWAIRYIFFTLKMMPFLLWFSFTAQLVVSKWIVADYRVLLQSARNQRNHYKLFSVAPSLWLISSNDSLQTPETSQHVVGEYRFSPEDICTTFTALSDTPTQLHTCSDIVSVSDSK